MGIGTSMGAYYDDSFHQAAASWDSKYDNNEIGVDQDNPALNDKNIGWPQDVQKYRTTPESIEENVGLKSPMPFPNNRNPDQDFNSRFGNLPPSGILNDLKPQNPDKPLIRKISDHTEFRSSDNIDDRRDSTYTLRQQWDDQNLTISKHFNDLINHPFERTDRLSEMPPGDPDSPIAKQAGVDDIKLGGEKNQNSFTDYVLQDIGRARKTIQGFIKGFNDVRRGYTEDFDTVLSTSEEREFEKWKDKNAPKDSGKDYDLRGAFKEGLTRTSEDQHLPDTYKKPSHPTFSDESKYAKDAPDLAGSWDGDTFIPPALK